MASTEPAVVCSGLVRRYGERRALDGIDLTLGEGQTLVVFGPNGAGKTTLLRVLSTLLRPSEGDASLLGSDLRKEGWKVRSKIGFLGHQSLCYGDLTARENLRYHARLHGINDAVAFVELESTFRDTMATGGSERSLVQVYTRDENHSYSSDAQYDTAMRALLNWVASNNKPTPASIASQCANAAANFEPQSGCRFLPEFQPQPLASMQAQQQLA